MMTNPEKHSQMIQKKREYSAIYEKKRYATTERKEYEAECVASGKRQKIEEMRIEKDKQTGRRKKIEEKRYATTERKNMKQNLLPLGKDKRLKK